MKWFLGAGILVLSIVGFVVFNQSPLSTVQAESTSEQEENEESASQSQGQYISSVPMPSSMTFCGDRVPLNRLDVQEALERELTSNTFFHSSTIGILKRSSRYLPVIERILAEQGLPDDLKYIAMAESGLISEKIDCLGGQVSKKGPRKVWQLGHCCSLLQCRDDPYTKANRSSKTKRLLQSISKHRNGSIRLSCIGSKTDL